MALLSKEEGVAKITKMVATNLIYKNNQDMLIEVEKRVKEWRNN